MALTAVESLLVTNTGYTAANVPESILELLRSDLEAARTAIKRSGIDLDEEKAADVNLLVAYASWLFTRRRTGEGKPPMISTEIRDRQVARATGGREDLP